MRLPVLTALGRASAVLTSKDDVELMLHELRWLSLTKQL